jgi:hypothetical protein
MEERAERRRKDFERKRQALLDKVTRERKEKRKRSSIISREISDMKEEIAKMRRTLSNRKEKDSVGKRERDRGRRGSQPQTARERKIIYVPLPGSTNYLPEYGH